MSLNVVTPVVCASCGGKFSGGSIACTKCLKLCCTACFSGLVRATATSDVNDALPTARICRKCNGGAPDEEDCQLHKRKHTLYCVNCSETICGGCIEPGEQHDIHRVENLAAMYLEKVARIGSKLIRAGNMNGALHAGAAAYRRNLELIEKEEESVLREVEAMAENCTLEVSLITTGRKEFLREKLRVPTANNAVLEEMRNKAKQLSPYGLLKQLADFERNCDQLIAQDNGVAMQKVHDVHCDLVPRYKYSNIVYDGFQHAAKGDAYDYLYKSAYDVEWKLTVKKTDMVQVKLNPKDAEVRKFRYMLVVIIPHQNYSKTVQESFQLAPGRNTFDVVRSAHLVEQGFCTGKHGDLELRIGIRCLNVVIERQLLDHLYCQIRNYLIMHFQLKLSDVKSGKELRSWQLRDDKSRSWALSVELKSGYVGCYLELRNGPPTCSDFFVELINTDPMKTIIYRTKHCFDTGRTWGWAEFVRLDTLRGDVGFYPDGSLHIRFGVRPLGSPDAKLAAPSAAANA